MKNNKYFLRGNNVLQLITIMPSEAIVLDEGKKELRHSKNETLCHSKILNNNFCSRTPFLFWVKKKLFHFFINTIIKKMLKLNKAATNQSYITKFILSAE